MRERKGTYFSCDVHHNLIFGLIADDKDLLSEFVSVSFQNDITMITQGRISPDH